MVAVMAMVWNWLGQLATFGYIELDLARFGYILTHEMLAAPISKGMLEGAMTVKSTTF